MPSSVLPPDEGGKKWLLPVNRSDLIGLDIRVPRPLRAALKQLVSHEKSGGAVELRVITRDRELELRELAAFLAFADRAYGRLTFGSLHRYARRANDHLVISEIRSGSLVFVFKAALDSLLSPSGLILTGLALKYLPNALRASATAYRDYEQAKLFQAQRRQLSTCVSADDQLQKLSTRDLSHLTSVLSKIYEVERNRSASAQSFSIRTVVEIIIKRTDE